MVDAKLSDWPAGVTEIECVSRKDNPHSPTQLAQSLRGFVWPLQLRSRSVLVRPQAQPRAIHA
jgi:hypothetical protein